MPSGSQVLFDNTEAGSGNFEPIYIPNPKGCMAALQQDECDLAFANILSANFLLKQEEYSNLKIFAVSNAIKRIRENADKELPVIVITAYDYSEIAQQAAEVGVTMFLSKPLFQSSLFNLLANVVGSPEPVRDVKPWSYDFSGARVPLAEDNAMNMEIGRGILESAGLKVDSAWNGQEAVQLYESAPAGTYKAILMDVQMPVMDGYNATRTIRASSHPEAASIPIIAMTADAFMENVAESMIAGMNDHISKPIDLKLLFETLRKYIGE